MSYYLQSDALGCLSVSSQEFQIDNRTGRLIQRTLDKIIKEIATERIHLLDRQRFTLLSEMINPTQ